MRCPHCGAQVSVLSRAINTLGKKKFCPACRQPVRLGVDIRRAVIWFIPAVIASILLAQLLAAVGLPDIVALALVIVAYLLYSAELRVFETKKPE